TDDDFSYFAQDSVDERALARDDVVELTSVYHIGAFLAFPRAKNAETETKQAEPSEHSPNASPSSVPSDAGALRDGDAALRADDRAEGDGGPPVVLVG